MEWKFIDEATKSWLKEIKKPKREQKEFDHIACVRSGELCFDILAREDNAELRLYLFVGGVDSGYGYDEDEYPYDFLGDVGFTFHARTFKNMDFETFKAYIIKKVDKLIKDSKPIPFKGTTYSLLDKANCPLNEW